ncbi:MAG: TonB-dependent receptor [Betaproteobacteria bacterium]|nr:TonB-dependent receptor [Betaproteobacteria bacterium]
MGIASISVGYRKEDRNGWAKNLTGPDLGAKDKEAYRLAATLDFSKDFKVDYTYDHSEINNTPAPTSLYSLEGWSGGLKTFWLPFASAFGGTFVVTALGNAQHNAMLPYVTQTRPDTVSTNGSAGIFERSRTEGHALVADYKLNDRNELKYIFSTRKMRYNDRQDIDGTPVNFATVFPGFLAGLNVYYDRLTDYKQDSHELQWIGNIDRLKYVLGLYNFKDDGTTVGAQNFDLFLGGPIRSDYSSRTNTKAWYGQLDYALAEAWTATAGVRQTREEKGGWTHRFNTTGYDGPFKSNIFGPVDYNATFSGTTPMAALAFKYSDTTNLYARVAKGFKSGGFSSELTSKAVLTPYKPQTSVSVELGVKNSFFNNRAQLNAAIFQNKISDQQLTQLVPASTESFLSNAGKSTYKGLELEGALIPVEGWKVQGSYGYLDTKYGSYIDNALNIAGRPLIDTASNKLAPYAPKNTASLTVDGRLTKTAWGTLRAIVDYTYVSSTYLYSVNKDLRASNAGGSYSAALDSIPALTNVNFKLLLAGIPVGGPGSADLAIWVKNVSDEKKQMQGIDFGMLRTANWQEPRSYGMTLNYKW